MPNFTTVQNVKTQGRYCSISCNYFHTLNRKIFCSLGKELRELRRDGQYYRKAVCLDRYEDIDKDTTCNVCGASVAQWEDSCSFCGK